MRSAALILQNLRACCGASTLLSGLPTASSSLAQTCSSDSVQHSFKHGEASSSSACRIAWPFDHVRHMGTLHKLSLKRANNKASWDAVRPFLEDQQPKQQHNRRQRKERATPIHSAIPELPKLDEPAHYRKIGKLTAPYSIAQQAAFAVVETGGSQFKVTTDDLIYHNKIPDVMINDVLEFGKVLLIGTQQETTIGRPFVPGATVIAAVEETFKDSKVYVFKKKKRKRYSKLQGYRAQMTALRVLEIRAPGVELPSVFSNSSSSIPQQTSLPAAEVRSRGLGSSSAAAAAAVTEDSSKDQAEQHQQQPQEQLQGEAEQQASKPEQQQQQQSQ